MQKMKKDNKILYQIKCRLTKECVKLCIVVRLSPFLFRFAPNIIVIDIIYVYLFYFYLLISFIFWPVGYCFFSFLY